MTTAEALETYDKVAAGLFSKHNRTLKLQSPFEASTLEDVVKQIVKQRSGSDLLKFQDGVQQKGKAFVCTVEDGNLAAIHRLRTYDIDDDSDMCLRDWKIWEAARATTAAPMNFKPMTIQRDAVKKTFLDAALGYNNPIEQLLDEAGVLFHHSRALGAVVSLGTGTREQSFATGDGVNILRYIKKTVGVLKNQTVDTERPHERVKANFKNYPDTYFRFNVPDGAENIGLSHWRKMEELKKLTTDYMNDEAVDQEINKLVDLLSSKKNRELKIGHLCRSSIYKSSGDRR